MVMPIPRVNKENMVNPMHNYTDLRAYTGGDTGVFLTSAGIEGYFSVDSTDTTSADNGGTIIVDSLGRRWKRATDGRILLKWFQPVANGTTDDVAKFNAAASAANSLQLGTNVVPYVVVTDGEYFVGSDTSPVANWLMEPNVKINGAPALSIAVGYNASRLKGSMIRFHGIDQWVTMSVGDPRFNTHELMDNLFPAEIMGMSNKGAGGITGSSRTGDRNGYDEATIGLTGAVLNDNTTTPRPAYGGYFEAVRTPNSGNTNGFESTIVNYGNVKQITPYTPRTSYDANADTFNIMLTSGGGSGSGAQDSTAAIGIYGKSEGAYDRGIIFSGNSIGGSDNEAIAMAHHHRIAFYKWRGSSEEFSGYLDGANLSMRAYDNPAQITLRRNNTTGDTQNGDIISGIYFQANIGGSNTQLASIRGVQTSTPNGGNTSGRIDFTIRQTNGVDRNVQLTPNSYSAPDLLLSLGTQVRRWTAAFCEKFRPGDGTVFWTSGSGSPEGTVTAPVGSMYTRTDGGTNTTLYVKETGTGSTGWVAK